MTRTIYKFNIDPVQSFNDCFHIPMGEGKVVLVAEQHGTLMVWVEGHHNLPESSLTLHVFGTGHLIDGDLEHVGSAVVTPFVWHVYQEKVQP